MAKILIVDDEEHIRFLYSEELSEAGYEVITADSGYKLIEKIEEEKPDLVVLDIKMVDYNGLDLLQDIRNRFYNLPVVLCTGHSEKVDEETTKSLRIRACLMKPITQEIMAETRIPDQG